LPEKTALLAAMKAEFGADERRIDHALRVLAHAEAILEDYPADRDIVVAAAILHDIGIQEAERKHGSSAGKWQEVEGPPVARRILEQLDADEPFIATVCALVGNHHSARGKLTPEFNVLWDADWLVNLADEYGDNPEKLAEFAGKVFRTPAGRRRAQTVLGV